MIHADTLNPLVRNEVKDDLRNKSVQISTNPTVYAKGDILYGDKNDKTTPLELDEKTKTQVIIGKTLDPDQNKYFVGVMDSFMVQ